MKEEPPNLVVCRQTRFYSCSQSPTDRLFVLTRTGVSAETVIPTFRGVDGLAQVQDRRGRLSSWGCSDYGSRSDDVKAETREHIGVHLVPSAESWGGLAGTLRPNHLVS
jgi:hypothetical protein